MVFKQFIQDDCIKVLPKVTNYISLIITDPPYNIKKAEWDTFESQKEYVDWSMAWIEEAHRVLSPNGSIYMWVFWNISRP